MQQSTDLKPVIKLRRKGGVVSSLALQRLYGEAVAVFYAAGGLPPELGDPRRADEWFFEFEAGTACRPCAVLFAWACQHRRALAADGIFIDPRAAGNQVKVRSAAMTILAHAADAAGCEEIKDAPLPDGRAVVQWSARCACGQRRQTGKSRIR